MKLSIVTINYNEESLRLCLFGVTNERLTSEGINT